MPWASPGRAPQLRRVRQARTARQHQRPPPTRAMAPTMSSPISVSGANRDPVESTAWHAGQLGRGQCAGRTRRPPAGAGDRATAGGLAQPVPPTRGTERGREGARIHARGWRGAARRTAQCAAGRRSGAVVAACLAVAPATSSPGPARPSPAQKHTAVDGVRLDLVRRPGGDSAARSAARRRGRPAHCGQARRRHTPPGRPALQTLDLSSAGMAGPGLAAADDLVLLGPPPPKRPKKRTRLDASGPGACAQTVCEDNVRNAWGFGAGGSWRGGGGSRRDGRAARPPLAAHRRHRHHPLPPLPPPAAGQGGAEARQPDGPVRNPGLRAVDAGRGQQLTPGVCRGGLGSRGGRGSGPGRRHGRRAAWVAAPAPTTPPAPYALTFPHTTALRTSTLYRA